MSEHTNKAHPDFFKHAISTEADVLATLGTPPKGLTFIVGEEIYRKTIADILGCKPNDPRVDAEIATRQKLNCTEYEVGK